jgi:penicillin-binding protein 1A
MANAYATIASGGMRNRPTAITKVTFPDGHSELPPRWKVRRTRAFEDGVTAKATEILEQNIQGGTGTKAAIGCPAGGKTGTTDLNTDAWFVGITPRLATAVWVGYPNDRTQMNGLFFGGPVDGGTFPAAIWGAYMKQAKGSFCGDFRQPKEPFQSSAFSGDYASNGGNKLGLGDEEEPSEEDSTEPEPSDEDTNPSGGTEFDPEQYEAPPQQEPDTGPPPGTEP